MAILFTTVQAYLVLQTLEYGTAWYIFAMSIITINDIAAYMCGFFFGSRPLILLSPKKTLEGFLGKTIINIIILESKTKGVRPLELMRHMLIFY
jgi:phosphatidate cytidylyltransferase